jgi:transposase-like protein
MGKRKEAGGLAGNVMLQVNGAKEAFACEQCGSNVFREVRAISTGELKWACNGCAAVYVRDTTEAT